MTGYRTSFELPEFTFSEETRQSLVEFTAEYNIHPAAEFIAKVENICRTFLGYDANESRRPPTGETNEKLRKIGEHAEKLVELLEDPAVQLKLSVLLQENTGRPVGISFQEGLIDSLRAVQWSVATVPPPKKGRPSGSVDTSGRYLAWHLCQLLTCYGVTVSNVTAEGKPCGVAHRLLDLLREPLEIGAGELDGIFRQVVDLQNKVTS